MPPIHNTPLSNHRRYTTPGSYTDSLTGTLALLGLLKPHVGATPLIAAGGIMTGQQVLAALAAGAAGVQLGTAFLAADEAGTSQAGRELLLQEPDRGTVLTQVGSVSMCVCVSCCLMLHTALSTWRRDSRLMHAIQPLCEC